MASRFVSFSLEGNNRYGMEPNNRYGTESGNGYGTESGNECGIESSNGQGMELSLDDTTDNKIENARSPMVSPIHKRRASHVMDKIPEEAESLTVMVGGVNFLEQPITAFIRLKEVKI